jgi:3-oxoacyl-[acyl-carrier-protein] synthase III
VYRNDFLCEPAVASIVAGRLQLDGKAPGKPGMLAFDLTNGSLGVLHACYAAAHMIASGNFRNALVMAAEVELNRHAGSPCEPRLEEIGSAMVLEPTFPDGPGFGAFQFLTSTTDLCKLRAHSVVVEGRTFLHFERHPKYERRCLELIGECFEKLLAAERLSRSQVAVVMPPLISAEFVNQLADVLGIPGEGLVRPPSGSRDLYTSSLAFGLDAVSRRGALCTGDVGIVIGVGSGMQVGCATYYF